MKKIVFVLLFLPRLAFGQGIPPTLNTWYSIPNTTLHNVCKSPEGTGGILLDCFFVTPAWSSGGLDATNDFFYITGGGHNDYLGNDYFRINLNTLAADRIQGPTLPPAATGTSPDCIPDSNYGGQCFSNSKHTYDGLVWLEWLHKMFQIGGSPSQNGGFTKSMWLIDPVNHVETRLTDNYSMSGAGGSGQTRIIGTPNPGGDALTCTAADEQNQVVYIVLGSDLFAVDPVANTMRRLTNRGTPFSQYFTCEYDPEAKRVMLIGGGQFGTFDVSGGPTVTVPGSGDASFVARTQTGCATCGASAPGIVYDINLHRIVTWGAVGSFNTIYLSDPASSYAWSPITTTNAQSPAITSTNQGVYKRFRLSKKKFGVYIYYGDMTQNALAIRLYAPDNFITIKDTSGSTQTNRVIPGIGRPFRAGDIPLCPEAWVDGVALQTQTDVKNRWPDGSLKFGIVSFVLPTLSANGTKIVTFVNGSSCNNTGGLTQAQALSGAFNFDVTMTVVGTSTRTTSARAMLAAGNWRLWGTGPVMTAFIIEDRSAARIYDMDPNSSGNRPFHPMFECRFFPSNNSVDCSAILENAWVSNTAGNSTSPQAISAYTLTAGSVAPSARAVNWAGNTTEDFTTHKFTNNSRAHKEFWVGTAPGTILIDHNLAYLGSSGLIVNFDSSFGLNATYVTNIASDWTGATKTIQGNFTGNQFLGNWERLGSDSGGSHPWIGLYSTWDIQYLYNPLNQTLYDKMIGNADLHGRLQTHMRELDNPAGRGLYYDAAYSSAHTATIGRPVSISARKGVSTQDFNETCGGTIGVDQINFPVTPILEWSGYLPGYAAAHAPSVGYIPYLLTGRYFYLEEIQMEAAYWLAWQLGCPTSGRRADQGFISAFTSEVRGWAWAVRSIAHAYAVSPDATPEQAYFKWYFLQNSVALEGQTDTTISDTTHQSAWDYGHTVVRVPDAGGYSGVSPIGQFYRFVPDSAPPDNILRWDGTPPRNVFGCNSGPDVASCGSNPWMEGFITAAIGEANDIGLNTANLLRYRSQYYLCLTTSGVGNFYLDQYLMPGKVEEQYAGLTAGQGWLPNWTSILQYLQSPRVQFNQSGGSDQQYEYIGLGAMGFFGGVSGVCGTDGVTAYTAVRTQMQAQLGLINRYNGTTDPNPENDSPKWAILPRTQNLPIQIAPPTSAPNPPSNVAVQLVGGALPGGATIWKNTAGSTNSDLGNAVAIGSNGSRYVAGSFQNTINFGGGPLTSAGSNDVFVAKYSAQGLFAWAKRFGSTADDRALAVAVDNGTGNVIIVGEFTGTVDFGTGPLVSAGGYDIFIASYAADGTPVWTKRIGTASDEAAAGVAIDSGGNVLVTGYFKNIVNFGGGSLTSFLGGPDTFVAKYTSAGAYVWAKNFWTNGDDFGTSIAVDGSDNVVFTGYFYNTVDFRYPPSVITFDGNELTSAGLADIYVAKLSSAGAYLWSKRYGSTLDDFGYGVAADRVNNEVAATGVFQGTVDFGGGPLVSAGGFDGFVIRTDAVSLTSGFKWAKRFGGASGDFGYAVAVDSVLHETVVTGAFNGTVNFGGGSLVSAGAADIFAVRYDVTGGHKWSRRYGSTLDDFGYGVAVDSSGQVSTTGGFEGTVDFGNGFLTSVGFFDIFLLNLAP